MGIMETDKQSLELTPEQKNKLREARIKLNLKNAFNGFQHGLMAIVMNFILTIANIEFFENDNMVQLFGCVFIIIFVLYRLGACQREAFEDYVKAVKEITKQ